MACKTGEGHPGWHRTSPLLCRGICSHRESRSWKVGWARWRRRKQMTRGLPWPAQHWKVHGPCCGRQEAQQNAGWPSACSMQTTASAGPRRSSLRLKRSCRRLRGRWLQSWNAKTGWKKRLQQRSSWWRTRRPGTRTWGSRLRWRRDATPRASRTWSARWRKSRRTSSPVEAEIGGGTIVRVAFHPQLSACGLR